MEYLRCTTFGTFENPAKLGCMVLEKSAWKSVYRIIDFTVIL